MTEIEKPYTWFGEPFTGRFADAHRGKHAYNLAHFGFSREMLRRHFTAYVERYGVALEN